MSPEQENKERIDFSGSSSGVTFKGDAGWRAVRYYREPGSPKVIQWVMKYSGGFVQNEKQATYVLLGFAVLAFAISLVLFFGGGGRTNRELPPGAIESRLRGQ